MEKIDLHIHSINSDGELNIYEIIKLATKNGCYKISITDHDFIDDYSSLVESQLLEVINGIEFNCSIKGMHILGYGIKNIDNIKKVLNNLHSENQDVAIKLIEKLHNKGFNISVQQLIAYLEVKNINYSFLDKRHVVKYLIENKYTKDVYETYKNLIGRGTDLYIPLKKIEPKEVLDLIHYNGGVSVLAHPFTLNYNNEDLLSIIKKQLNNGLDGIEIINGNIKNEGTDYYNKIAKDLNMLRTIGSDFHSSNSRTIGVNYEGEIYPELIEKIKSRKV